MSAAKKFVFVLMPFRDEFSDIYKLGIKDACQSDKIYCERVDEQYYEGSILERVYNQIQHADCLIADMTGQNANVFYEVGFAHGLGKHVILITQDGDDIPFDMKHYQHIIYDKNKISELQDKIRVRVEHYLSKKEDSPYEEEPSVLVAPIPYINGLKMHEDESVRVELDLHGSYSCDFQITLFNPNEEPMNDKVFITFQAPVQIEYGVVRRTLLPGGITRWELDQDGTIPPKDYTGHPIMFRVSNNLFSDKSTKVFSISGSLWIKHNLVTLKYPFVLYIK